MPAVRCVCMVQRERTAESIAVVEDDRAARIAKRRQRRVRDRTTVHAAGLAGERSDHVEIMNRVIEHFEARRGLQKRPDRKSTRLNSSHGYISYAVFCLKK